MSYRYVYLGLLLLLGAAFCVCPIQVRTAATERFMLVFDEWCAPPASPPRRLAACRSQCTARALVRGTAVRAAINFGQVNKFFLKLKNQ